MTLIQLASLFEENKMWLVTASGLDKDALHIYFGLALFQTVRLIWRWDGGWLIAWCAVFAMACGGEWLDMTAEISKAAVQPDSAHWHDIRSEEHTFELQSLMRISYAVFCLKKENISSPTYNTNSNIHTIH